MRRRAVVVVGFCLMAVSSALGQWSVSMPSNSVCLGSPVTLSISGPQNSAGLSFSYGLKRGGVPVDVVTEPYSSVLVSGKGSVTIKAGSLIVGSYELSVDIVDASARIVFKTASPIIFSVGQCQQTVQNPPTPTTPLSCKVDISQPQVNQVITVTASGGISPYDFSAPGASVPNVQSGSSNVFKISYPAGAAGQKSVAVTSGSGNTKQTAYCIFSVVVAVVVVTPQPPVTTPPANPVVPPNITPPVFCTVTQSNIPIGQSVFAWASGGTGNNYLWSLDGINFQPGTGNSFPFTFSTAGQKTITVKSGTATGTCYVSVVALQPSPPTTPVTPPVPTPTVTPLSCGPYQQTVQTNDTATVNVFGGTPPYIWSAQGSTLPIPTGSSTSLRVAYPTPNTYKVTVSSGKLQETCYVYVVAPSAPLPTAPVSPPSSVSPQSVPEISVIVHSAGDNHTLQYLFPGGIATIYGINFADHEDTAHTLPLPTQLADIIVRVNGIVAPLFYVGPYQVNFQIPYYLLSEGNTVQIEKVGAFGAILSSIKSMGVTTHDVQLFESNGQPIVFNWPDNKPNSQDNPVHIYNGQVTFITVGTGVAPISLRPLLGQTLAEGQSAVVDPIVRRYVVVNGGEPVPLGYAGLAPGYVGLLQFNASVKLPAGQYEAYLLFVDPTHQSRTKTFVLWVS